jgi:hypothetical protein
VCTHLRHASRRRLRWPEALDMVNSRSRVLSHMEETRTPAAGNDRRFLLRKSRIYRCAPAPLWNHCDSGIYIWFQLGVPQARNLQLISRLN